MTDLMQLLYDYTFRTLLPALLTADEYQTEQVLLDQQENALLDVLPEAGRKELQEFKDCQTACASLELEAMFQAALTLARELP